MICWIQAWMQVNPADRHLWVWVQLFLSVSQSTGLGKRMATSKEQHLCTVLLSRLLQCVVTRHIPMLEHGYGRQAQHSALTNIDCQTLFVTLSTQLLGKA